MARLQAFHSISISTRRVRIILTHEPSSMGMMRLLRLRPARRGTRVRSQAFLIGSVFAVASINTTALPASDVGRLPVWRSVLPSLRKTVQILIFLPSILPEERIPEQIAKPQSEFAHLLTASTKQYTVTLGEPGLHGRARVHRCGCQRGLESDADRTTNLVSARRARRLRSSYVRCELWRPRSHGVIMASSTRSATKPDACKASYLR